MVLCFCSSLPEDEWFSEAAKVAITKLLHAASGSEAEEAEDESVLLHQEPIVFLHQEHIVSDSDDSISCPSTTDSFHSFVSAEMGDPDSPSHSF